MFEVSSLMNVLRESFVGRLARQEHQGMPEKVSGSIVSGMLFHDETLLCVGALAR